MTAAQRRPYGAEIDYTLVIAKDVDLIRDHLEIRDHLDELTPAFCDMLVAARSRTALQARADERLRSAGYDTLGDAWDADDLLATPQPGLAI